MTVDFMRARTAEPRMMRGERGFTLIELAMVIVIVGVMIALFAGLTTSLLAQQRRQTTVNKMATIDAALVQYVMQQKRLPCPADGRLASNDSSFGLEQPLGGGGTCTNSQQYGIVPAVTIGLSAADIEDGWGRRITYRVDPTLTISGYMNMSYCDPAGTGSVVPSPGGVCNTSCTSSSLSNCTPPATFISTKGLTVKNVSGTVVMNPSGTLNTGAAYVLISAGETGGGAYTNAGQVMTSTTTDGTQEQQNYANVAYVSGTTYYVDDQISDVAGTTHFDDTLVRPTILSVVTRAGLGPRSH